MTPAWIICESTSRWAPALRMAAAEHAASLPTPRIHQFRSLAELRDQSTRVSHSLLLVEVTSKDLEAALSWLAIHSRGDLRSPVIALLDLCETDVSPRLTTDDKPSGQLCDHRNLISGALREAGAMDVLSSPRQIGSVLAIGYRLAAGPMNAASARPNAEQSFANWAWSLLPWQDAGRPVG